MGYNHQFDVDWLIQKVLPESYCAPGNDDLVDGGFCKNNKDS